ncbi:MAG: hypothetical protein AAF197_06215 [Pseudomonadota bacterium]
MKTLSLRPPTVVLQLIILVLFLGLGSFQLTQALEMTDRFTGEKYLITDILDGDDLSPGQLLEIVALADNRRFQVIVDGLTRLGDDLELEASELHGHQHYFFEIIFYR